MKRDKNTTYLRLVEQTDAEPPKKEKVTKSIFHRKEQQLALPYRDPSVAVFADVKDIEVGGFAELLSSLSPKWIIDARTTPRLDMLGGSRSNAFKLFDSNDAEYVDLFGQLGLATCRSADANPASWAVVVGEIIRSSGKPFGPFLILFDNTELLKAAADALPSSLHSTLGRAISCSVMS